MLSTTQLFPLLDQSLSLENATHAEGALSAIATLVRVAPEKLSEHVSSLIPRLLSFTNAASVVCPSCTCSQSARLFLFLTVCQCVRKMALRSLRSMCRMPHHRLYPFKQDVIRGLERSLDDRIRSVRLLAVACRNEWYEVCQ